MVRVAAVGIALLFSQTNLAFADAQRGNAAFSQGDYSTANHEWREAAQAGDASAMLGLGLMYDTGHGEPQDFAHALSWYRRAAEAGDAHAMFNVGAMYDNGRGTFIDRREAARWYAMSAAKGNGRAAYAAATLYRDGDGVPRNTATAIKFFKMAAAAGIGAARANLANLGQAASPAADAKAVPPPGTAPKTSDAAVASVQPTPPPAGPRAASMQSASTIQSSRAPEEKPSSPTVATAAPPGATSDDFRKASTNIPIGPAKPFGPSPVQVPTPGAFDAQSQATQFQPTGTERFHKAALQRASISQASVKQYESMFNEIIRKAAEGDQVAQYDAGFAYERGVGVPSDLVRSYVYYIRATLTQDAALKSAALNGAFAVGKRLNDAQQSSAADILSNGDR